MGAALLAMAVLNFVLLTCALPRSPAEGPASGLTARASVGYYET